MPALEPRHVETFGAMVATRFGLDLATPYAREAERVLQVRLWSGGHVSADAYLEALAGLPDDHAELRALVELLTVGETYFFRDAPQFDALSDLVFAERSAAGRRGPVRVLSAACGTGEEPYSVMITWLERAERLGGTVPLEVHGIDVNPTSVERARQGLYSSWSLRAVSDSRRLRWFEPEGSSWRVRKEVRERVTFDCRNLAGQRDCLGATRFDVVFCRNMLMYLTQAAARAVVGRLARALAPGGFLFLGYAESIRGLSDDFHLRQGRRAFFYQRREKQARSAPPPSSDDQTRGWVDSIRVSSERIATLDASRATNTPRREDGRRRYLLALDATREERYADALALVESIAEDHDPDSETSDAEVQLLKATLLVNAGRLKEAEITARRLLDLGGPSTEAQYVLALCAEQEGDVERAAAHDRAALELDGGFAMPHLHLGLMARRCGDMEGAARELSTALALLGQEGATRLLLFGGGFSRATLEDLCRAELRGTGPR